MGELIKFPQLKIDEPEQTERHLDIDKVTFVLYILTSMIKTRQITGQGEISKAYMAHVSGYADNELIGWLNSATEEKIKEKPLFFHALVEVARGRDFFPKIEINK